MEAPGKVVRTRAHSKGDVTWKWGQLESARWWRKRLVVGRGSDEVLRLGRYTWVQTSPWKEMAAVLRCEFGDGGGALVL
jgi:hypothetical protein